MPSVDYRRLPRPHMEVSTLTDITLRSIAWSTAVHLLDHWMWTIISCCFMCVSEVWGGGFFFGGGGLINAMNIELKLFYCKYASSLFFVFLYYAFFPSNKSTMTECGNKLVRRVWICHFNWLGVKIMVRFIIHELLFCECVICTCSLITNANELWQWMLMYFDDQC